MRYKKKLGHWEQIWNCGACDSGPFGAKSVRFCHSCGHKQDPKWRRFPNQKDAVKTAPSPHPDKICIFCNVANQPKNSFCEGCGASLEKAKSLKPGRTDFTLDEETLEEIRQRNRKEEEQRREALKAVHDKKVQRAREVQRARSQKISKYKKASYQVKNSKKGRFQVSETISSDYQNGGIDSSHIMMGVGAVGLTILLGFVLFWSKEVQVEIVGKTWVRTQVIEKYKKFEEDSWCSQMPVKAEEKRRYDKKSGTRTITDCIKCDCHMESVKVGSKEECGPPYRVADDAGGYSMEQDCLSVPLYEDKKVCEDKTHEEPVYDDYCEYTIDRWTKDRVVKESGTWKKDPIWPHSSFDDCSQIHLGCERLGKKNQKYTVHYQDLESKESYECDWTQEKWSSLKLNSLWDAKVKMTGFKCNSLQPAS